jgi:hypothetical protein
MGFENIVTLANSCPRNRDLNSKHGVDLTMTWNRGAQV